METKVTGLPVLLGNISLARGHLGHNYSPSFNKFVSFEKELQESV